LLDFRNKCVAHFDLPQEFSRPIPRFEPALHVAYAYHEWVRVLIKGMWRIDHTLSPLYYEQCKAEAISVINSQKPKG